MTWLAMVGAEKHTVPPPLPQNDQTDPHNTTWQQSGLRYSDYPVGTSERTHWTPGPREGLRVVCEGREGCVCWRAHMFFCAYLLYCVDARLMSPTQNVPDAGRTAILEWSCGEREGGDMRAQHVGRTTSAVFPRPLRFPLFLTLRSQPVKLGFLTLFCAIVYSSTT